MPNLPLVTVVTVTYNSSAFVRDAIDSVLASSYESFELIVGDDASTDETWEIVNSYSDQRIVSYRNEVNMGEYPNRNKAIDLAKGEYLIFIDGDDMIYPHGLEFMISMTKRCSNCGMVLMYPYLNWVFLPVNVSSRDFYLLNFFHKGFNDIAFANTLFKTKALLEFSRIPSSYKSGDTYIRLRIASKYPTLIIQDQLTWWRETPGQASEKLKNSPESVIENYFLHAEIILDLENPLNTMERVKAISNELFKIKVSLLHCAMRLRIRQLLMLVVLVLKSGLTYKIIMARRSHCNPLSEFSSVRPLRYN